MGHKTLEAILEECNRQLARVDDAAVARLEGILRTDPAAHVLDTRALALRLVIRGVRA